MYKRPEMLHHTIRFLSSLVTSLTCLVFLKNLTVIAIYMQNIIVGPITPYNLMFTYSATEIIALELLPFKNKLWSLSKNSSFVPIFIIKCFKF